MKIIKMKINFFILLKKYFSLKNKQRVMEKKNMQI